MTDLSKQISKGVPGGCGGDPVPPCVVGPLSGVQAMGVDEGRLWVAEKVEGTPETRVDGFDASLGGFISPQLNENASVKAIDGGVAAGSATGESEVYVKAAEVTSNVLNVVAVFGSSAGVFQSAWTGAGTSNGSFVEHEGRIVGQMTGLAVDNHPLGLEDPAAGDVYIATRESLKKEELEVLSPEEAALFARFNVVDVFAPEAGGGEPSKPVAELRGTCPSLGTCAEGEVIPFRNVFSVSVSAANGDVLVGDRAGVLEGGGEPVVDVFEPAGLPGQYNFVRQIPLPLGGGLAADGVSGNFYVVEANGVNEYSPTGEQLGRLAGSSEGHPFSEVRSLAVDPATGRVFVGDWNGEKGTVDVFGPDLIVPDVQVTEPVSNLTPTGATLHGSVNPVEAGEATCEFEYGTSTAYGQHANCTKPVANGNTGEPVESVPVTGLSPDTTYHYRLDASNASGTNTGRCPEDCGQFSTPGPGIHSESASNVKSTSVTLEASIDPNHAPTTYYFQYGPTTSYGNTAPLLTATEPHGATVGSGEGDVKVSQYVQVGLAPGSTYHYRTVAVSEPEPGKVEEFDGPDKTFTMQTVGGAATLPDGRAWEMVSPPDKHGANLLEMAGGGRAIQASVAGNAMTYLATAPTEAQPEGFAVEVQVLSTRDSSGWASRDIATPHKVSTGGLSGAEYLFFSSDLALGAVHPVGTFDPAISPEASENTPYLRTNYLNGDSNRPCFPSTTHCYRPLVTGKPGFENVPPGTVFGGEPLGKCPEVCGPALAAATPDLSHIVIQPGSSGLPALTETSVTGGLYEWHAGELQLVSVLPASEGGGGVSGRLGNIERETTRSGALSGDGSRVVWAAEVGVEGHLTRHLYMSNTATGEAKSVRLDVVQSGTGGGPVDPVFQVASSDGSKVFFTDTQALTEDAGATTNEPDLYECEIVEAETGELECLLSDVTPLSGEERANVRAGSKLAGPSQGALVGASEDASWVYFVAVGVLTGSEANEHGEVAQHGQPNLYVHHAGVTRLVAVLSGADQPDWANGHGSLATIEKISAQVTPDGGWLAFMSLQSLTGYDNRDAVTGQPDEEVFLYYTRSAHLVCASCDPTGGRPSGMVFKEGGGPTEEEAAFLSGNIGWVGSTSVAGLVPGWTTDGYQSRYLSDAGRLFFDSHGALVPQDVNGTWDVYEYEPPGVGGCVASSATYSALSGGCVGLISSGTSAEPSAFLDASAKGGGDGEGHEGGGDVFFLTSGKLAPQDFDTSLDVYDAHECTASSPCFAAAGALPPACSTEAACKAPPSPQPQIFGAGGSATSSGAGNLPPSGPAKGKTAAQIRAERLAKALKACRVKHNRHRRAVCERQARKRFGPAHKAKKSGSAKTGAHRRRVR
jgi:hypothetical protein